METTSTISSPNKSSFFMRILHGILRLGFLGRLGDDPNGHLTLPPCNDSRQTAFSPDMRAEDRRNGASNLLCREPMFIKMFIKTRPPALKAVLQLFRSP